MVKIWVQKQSSEAFYVYEVAQESFDKALAANAFEIKEEPGIPVTGIPTHPHMEYYFHGTAAEFDQNYKYSGTVGPNPPSPPIPPLPPTNLVDMVKLASQVEFLFKTEVARRSHQHTSYDHALPPIPMI